MKKYTLEDFETFEKDEYGYTICPNGDYSEIKSFGARCRFGEQCRFGECCSFGAWCRFGEWCSFEARRVEHGTYFACDRIGSERRKTYFFKNTKTGDMFGRGAGFLRLTNLLSV